MSINENILWDKALSLFPMGVQTASKQANQFIEGVYPKFIEQGDGCYVYDLSSRPYVDYIMSLGPIILGHNNPVIKTAVLRQLDKGTIFSLSSPIEIELAELIQSTIPGIQDWKFKFGKNGSDICHAAIRVAASKTNKFGVATSGFHGWSDDHMALTTRPYGITPFLKDFTHEFEFNNLESLENILKNHECGSIILETQALTAPKPGFIEGVRKLADQYGAILIFDDIVFGFRYHLAGSIGYFNVVPDIVLYAKAISNGFPVSVMAGKPEIMEEFNNKVFFSGTFLGETLGIAAAIATIDILKNKDFDHIWKLGNMMKDGFMDLTQGLNLKFEMLGSAPRMNFKFDENEYEDFHGMRDLFLQEMCKRGFLFGPVIYPTFAHSKKIIENTISAAREAFKIIRENIGQVDKVLEGKRSSKPIRKNT